MSHICCSTIWRKLVSIKTEIAGYHLFIKEIFIDSRCFRTSICEFIKPKLQEERQWDWFTPETCEAQYRQLYNENVKSSINNENPLQQIVKSLKSSSLIPYCL